MNATDVFHYIDALVAEEQRLLARRPALNKFEKKRLTAVRLELNRYWDLLRRRLVYAEVEEAT